MVAFPMFANSRCCSKMLLTPVKWALVANDPMNRWRNRRSATSFRYEILWEVPNFWVGFFLVSKGYGRICYQIPHLPIELENFFLIRGPSSLNKNISTTTDCTNRSCEFFRGVRGSIAGFFIHPRHFPILVEVCR